MAEKNVTAVTDEADASRAAGPTEPAAHRDDGDHEQHTHGMHGHHGEHHAAHQALSRHAMHIRLPMLGTLSLPPPQHLAFYGGLVALVAVEVIEWPIAAALAVGKALSEQHSNHVLEDFGEALEAGA